MTRERLYALEYTMYMIIEQDLSLNSKHCKAEKGQYLKRLALAWAELPGSFVDQDFEKCEKIFAEDIQPLFTKEFYDKVQISVIPSPSQKHGLSIIRILADLTICDIRVTLDPEGNVICTKTKKTR